MPLSLTAHHVYMQRILQNETSSSLHYAKELNAWLQQLINPDWWNKLINNTTTTLRCSYQQNRFPSELAAFCGMFNSVT